MPAITIKTIEEEKVWEAFLAKHPEANFLQSWYWGEFNKSLGKNIHRLGYFEGSKLAGVMLSVTEAARRGRYMAVAGGPILDWHNQNLVRIWAESLRQLINDQKCVFVRVRPQLISNDFAKTIFAQAGFRPSPMHLSAELTSQLDLSKSEDEIMADMRQQTRYEIRKAIKQCVKVSQSSSPQDLKAFYDLQMETAKRQGFVPFSYDFLEKQFRTFAEHDMAKLYSAHRDGKLLAQAFVIFYGEEAAYHYGASTLEGRKYPGAPLIQWQAIREAKKRGMSRYNFWGVAPAGEASHRFHGVSVFKRGFGGEDVEYLHAQDLVVNKTKYALNLAVEVARKKIRHV
ncbi:peptidoglycan bridge formation glycyltransferase FemA/FemB family protein [Candidatus Saccharibacteria bacterium]|nr:peptidoglycan bridge formation glycyltransferase FemA/FemB family protein [Candidatus Saccharibacteria bacterium]